MEKVKEKTAASYDFQDELLKTYFSTSPTTATAYTPAEVPQKNERTHQVLLIITASLIVLFLVLIFLLSKYNIVITPITRQQTTAGDSDDDRILLSKDGEIDRDFIENIIFYEGADKKSGWEKGLVSLLSEKDAPMARFGIDFKRPLDLTVQKFCFTAKDAVPDQDLRLLLRDASGNACYAKIGALTDEWQPLEVDMRDDLGYINARAISHIEFQISKTGNNAAGILNADFKDLSITKKEGVR